MVVLLFYAIGDFLKKIMAVSNLEVLELNELITQLNELVLSEDAQNIEDTLLMKKDEYEMFEASCFLAHVGYSICQYYYEWYKRREE